MSVYIGLIWSVPPVPGSFGCKSRSGRRDGVEVLCDVHPLVGSLRVEGELSFQEVPRAAMGWCCDRRKKGATRHMPYLTRRSQKAGHDRPPTPAPTQGYKDFQAVMGPGFMSWGLKFGFWSGGSREP